jgi:type II secretory pathway component PulM
LSALEPLRARWAELAPRDRRALRLGGIALAVLLPLLAAWSIRDHLADRRAQLEASRTLAATAAERIAARLAAGADVAAATTTDATALQARLTRAAERAGLAGTLGAAEPIGSDRLRVALRDAPYDAAITLLGSLARWEGITVVSADLTRSGPGRVDAALVLRGP